MGVSRLVVAFLTCPSPRELRLAREFRSEPSMMRLVSNDVRTRRVFAEDRFRTPASNARSGWTTAGLVLCVSGLLLVGATVLQFATDSFSGLVSGLFSSEPEVELLTTEVTSGPFVHVVLERGEIESSSNVEIRCKVSSRNSGGTTILEIVPEGAQVDAGAFLARLDDSALKTELIQQEIVASNSESMVIEAQAVQDAAELNLLEYEQGTFNELEAQQESEVFVAEENLRRAEEYLVYSKRLAERGYIPEAQLEADTFAVEKARKDLGVANTRLHVLRTFTKKKTLTQLRADIATAKARLKARKKTWELDQRRQAEIEQQIVRCQIFAPIAGQVVYANDQDRRGSSGDLLIAEGRPVRERQVMFRLPDENKMRVIAKVHESRISSVQPGMMADIVLDALSELTLSGRVTAVSEYPIPSYSVYMAHIKEYAVSIEIVDPPVGLRPGMTAQVKMLVERQDSATQVPLQAVLERAGRFFAAVLSADGSLETRDITVGSANEDNIVVLSGLQPGESVVLNLNDEGVVDQLDLPDDEASVESVADRTTASPNVSSSVTPKLNRS